MVVIKSSESKKKEVVIQTVSMNNIAIRINFSNRCNESFLV